MENIEELGKKYGGVWTRDRLVKISSDFIPMDLSCMLYPEINDYDGDILLYKFKDGVVVRSDLKNTLPVQNEFRYNIDSFSFLLIRQGKLLVCHLSLFGLRLDAWREGNISLGFAISKSMYLLYKHLVKVNEIKQLRKKIKRKLRWKRK